MPISLGLGLSPCMGGGGQGTPTGDITSALLAHWELDEGTGTALADSSGNGYDATLTNGTWAAPGLISGSFPFCNGATAYAVSDSSVDFGGSQVITAAFWLQWDIWDDLDDICMELSTNFNTVTATEAAFVVVPNDPTGDFCFKVRSNNELDDNPRTVAAIDRPGDGGWHHYVLVMDMRTAPATMTAYMDGAAVTVTISDADSLSDASFGTQPIYLMSRAGSSLFGKGGMQDVRLYTRALDALDVAALYAATAPAPVTPATFSPSIWVRAKDHASLGSPGDGAAVTAWDDVSGNGRDLTAASAPVYHANGGAPYVGLDGVDDYFFRNAAWMYGAGAASVMISMQLASLASPAGAYFASEGSSASNNPLYLALTNASGAAASDAHVRVRNDANTVLLTGESGNSGLLNINTAIVLGIVDTGSAIQVWLNGVKRGSPLPYTRSGSLSLNRFSLGALLRASAIGFMAGRVYEMVAIPSAVSDANAAALSRYMGGAFQPD